MKVTVVCSQEDKYCGYRDGFPIVLKEELMELDFEYVVITSSVYFKQIKAEAINLGVSLNRIINGQVFKIPLFGFGVFMSLINTLWDKNEYVKFNKILFLQWG